MDQKEILRVSGLSATQRRRLIHFLHLFNHGLWPREEGGQSHRELFPGIPYENQGREWTAEADARCGQFVGGS